MLNVEEIKNDDHKKNTTLYMYQSGVFLSLASGAIN